VLQILQSSADAMGPSRQRNSDVGYGRINAYSALRLAGRFGS
jgi:hypothetical protein